ncbi:hypothetical protein B4070_1970 [Bacillus subtilis]|jgi:hypothetical protein|uniref:Uncharacterized protein n=1 Tax=Bacillus subtilis subsp. subtilis TaxID=135461 RepID=A0ABD3ZTM7_BACIU|nr:hypothetical protein B4067_2109 [Bacillus subtilis subsp. subtilis]KIN33762.1 hypothetical protein B4070_1970 [Bacillus subtilis]
MLIRSEIVAEINTEHKKEGETPVFIAYARCIPPHNRYAQALSKCYDCFVGKYKKKRCAE